MDQTPPFQPSFGMDFFAPIHIPHGLTFPDHTDLPKRKASYADYPDHSYMDHSSLFHPQRDDEYTNEHFNALRADAKAWQPPQPHQPHGFLDASLEPWFGRDKDFGLDPFQICRSRGGSFNFGHLRRDSEDFFHMNSDFFRHIKNITEAKTPVIENNFRKKSFQVPDSGECYAENPYAFSNQLNHNFAAKAPEFTSTISNHAQPTGLMATPQNTESTVDSAGEGSAKKRGRKKRMLNDKTECYDDAPVTKAAAKPGRPKKTKDNNEEESVPKTQLQKAKSLMVKNEACNIKQERDDKSTEISSSASKLEDSPNLKPKTDIMSEIMKLKAPENLKEILGGMNVPNEVKEFFQKTSWMGQTSSVESRKIGTLTVAERRVKIEKYLQKRKKRTWSRKINYDCRKRVADSRLRIKGRFVTREQAFALMDDANITYNPETITNAEIKVLLAEKFGGSILKKKSSENQSTSLCIKRPSDKELDEQDLDDGEDEGSELSE